jgi:Domain of unknown function(DUF2779)
MTFWESIKLGNIMNSKKIPMLSKSKYLAGLQCPLRLWHQCFNPALASPVSPTQQALFDTGHKVGQLATRLYPEGVLVETDPLGHQQAVPFQWSDHVLHEGGRVEHRESLCEEDKDPREEFAKTLLGALGNGGSIVTYTNYEEGVIKELAEDFPQYRDQLLATLDRVELYGS